MLLAGGNLAVHFLPPDSFLTPPASHSLLHIPCFTRFPQLRNKYNFECKLSEATQRAAKLATMRIETRSGSSIPRAQSEMPLASSKTP